MYTQSQRAVGEMEASAKNTYNGAESASALKIFKNHPKKHVFV